MSRIRRPVFALAITAVALAARGALAGTPLTCFPFAIGQARSLPIGPGAIGSVDPKYDISRLVHDTIDLLGPTTPVIVRMETLRRASIYARANSRAGADLLAKLRERASVSNADAGLAVFDFGYLAATYREVGIGTGDGVDGYELVLKAIALQRDPEMEFAAAIITWPRPADQEDHLRKAAAAATSGSLLAVNLVSHFSSKGRSIEEIQASLAGTK
jgi:hypothetical protein